MVLDDVFRPDRPHGLPGSTATVRGPVEEAHATQDQVFCEGFLSTWRALCKLLLYAGVPVADVLRVAQGRPVSGPPDPSEGRALGPTPRQEAEIEAPVESSASAVQGQPE
jgi:hypothetical protein